MAHENPRDLGLREALIPKGLHRRLEVLLQAVPKQSRGGRYHLGDLQLFHPNVRQPPNCRLQLFLQAVAKQGRLIRDRLRDLFPTYAYVQ
eukprot:CAMPEP_0183405140 /NCGR_PEP_ID=MMETSP0370-20130417/15593_1 /TAXON_ID=268820 /ORGANISM="Peridinium aciculiferum, Strain PAER-2" /LENGTH=89 /DNA_ID=CAMNT_0025587055 /DNA_START=70 /DNA_END=339 /DNA_ORIENTATION=-